MEKLFTLIKINCEPEQVIEAYKITGTGLRVGYEAILGERLNKKGETKECYLSIYGKYAGAIKKDKPPPTLSAYVQYDEESFTYDKDTKTFHYIKETICIKGTILKVVKN